MLTKVDRQSFIQFDENDGDDEDDDEDRPPILLRAASIEQVSFKNMRDNLKSYFKNN